MARKSKRFKITRKLALISGLAVLIIASSGLGYWHYHNRPSKVVIPVAPTQKTTSSASTSNSQSNTSSVVSDKQTAPAGGYTTASGGQGSGPSDGTGQPPRAPTGPFVSNHGLDAGHPASTENSVCNTTPGASCYIEFTQGSSTKTLLSGTADSNGSVYWNNWNVSDYLGSGVWTVSATATLNGQTVSSANNEMLTVQ